MIVAIAAGDTHTLALDDQGDVYTWGRGNDGQLGYGNTNSIGDDETPTSAGTVNLGGANIVAISAGESHSLALDDQGNVYAWGSGILGELGYGNNSSIGDNETPISAGPIMLGGASIVAISAGGFHSLALTAVVPEPGTGCLLVGMGLIAGTCRRRTVS